MTTFRARAAAGFAVDLRRRKTMITMRPFSRRCARRFRTTAGVIVINHSHRLQHAKRIAAFGREINVASLDNGEVRTRTALIRIQTAKFSVNVSRRSAHGLENHFRFRVTEGERETVIAFAATVWMVVALTRRSAATNHGSSARPALADRCCGVNHGAFAHHVIGDDHRPAAGKLSAHMK